MAGSFDIFRKYQRSLLVAVAVLAMLAFFVLPPLLQLGPDVGAGDPVVATWKGGEIRESGLMRGVAMRSVLNQFLLDAVAASGRDPGRMQVLPEDEEDVVRTMLLARQAADQGIVVSNAAINEFLGQWTNNMVRPEQLEALITRRRLGSVPVSPADVFETLRAVLAANRMERLFMTGFAGDPPGRRWDHFRSLEQGAKVEVVPVVVQSLIDRVPAPATPVLETFFAKYRDDLPSARSPDPGFREPHRISCEYLVAKSETLEAEVAAEVTDEAVQKFYDANKERLYRAKAADAAAEPKPEAKPAAEAAEPAAGTTTETKAESKPEPKPEPKTEAPAGGTAPAPQSAVGRSRFLPAAFRQPGKESETATADAGPKPPAEDAGKAAAPSSAAGTADDKTAAKAAEPGAFEPLDKVREDIRKRLAKEAAGRRIDAVFAAVTADVTRYAEDLALWQAQVDPASAKPQPPDVDAIAKKQGLEAGRLQDVRADEALDQAPVAATFEIVPDADSPMGFRQASWVGQLYGRDTPLLRTIGTRDVAGNRYLTWKTADRPAAAPKFADVRTDVERAWRIVEARPLARKIAEEIVAQAAAGGTLADAVAKRSGDPKLEATTVGTFTWFSRSEGRFGSAPVRSQPEGLSMPGDEFMRAVFALDPGGTAVAFNEPRTVCYAVRVEALEPAEEELRKRFLDPATDQRRLAALGEEEETRAYDRWIGELERERGLQWKRPPQRMRQ
jgi:hypothetical protein